MIVEQNLKNDENINNINTNLDINNQPIQIENDINDNMILKELQEEDRKVENEIKGLKEFDNTNYDIKLKQLIDCPIPINTKIEEKIECFVVRFEKYDNLLAAGYSNGSICVFNLETEKPKIMKVSEYPVTSLRWKPHTESKPKNILVSVTADGKITHWHTTSGKALHTMEEKDNPIMCLDYSQDGTYFATAGNDRQVRLYDDNTKTLLKIMKPGSFNQPGHSNRIFSVNFHKENTNLMASGGWDNTIQFYDLRQGTIVNSVYGPHICGDSIDMKGDYLLTGSWTVKDQLQLWDLRMFKVSQNLMWEKGQVFYPTYIYTTQFSKNPNRTNLFGVGGSNNSSLRIFEDDTKEKLPQVCWNYMTSPCYSIDFSNKGGLMAYGCGDGGVRLLTTEKKN